MAQYVQKAVDELYNTFFDKLETELGDVETDEGAISLPMPKKIVKSRNPDLNVTPLMQIYETDWEFLEGGQRNSVMRVDCRVVLSLARTKGRDDLEVTARRYLTAMIKTVEDNNTLQSTVAGAEVIGGSSDVGEGDDSGKRHTLDMGVAVYVQSA